MAVFLAPFFLAGALLIGLPWLIHHIRRPEREPIVFSSLMFLPKVTKEVIERRKLQHLLLMLLRMLLLLLMVLAFSRPFVKQREQLASESAEPGAHLILLDLSYSMNMSDRFAKAQAKARQILREIPKHVPVAVVGFAQRPQLLAGLDGGAEQSQALARSAIDRARPGQAGTRYQTALQYAENLLLAGRDPGDTAPSVLHLVSDFARGGMPDDTGGWRLSGRIIFRGYLIDRPLDNNLSLLEIGRSEKDGVHLIAGKVKNWSNGKEAEANVRFFLGDELMEEKLVTVAPGGATQVRFTLAGPGKTERGGRLALGQDDFELDNQRHFVWKSPPKMSLLLLADKSNNRWPPDWFLERALINAGQAPWLLDRATGTDLSQKLSAEWDVVLVAGLTSLSPETVASLSQYVKGGGRVLLTLNQGLKPQTLQDTLLNGLGIVDQGLRFEPTSQNHFDILGWIDFNHPSFLPFSGIRFNDFSALRFHNYHMLHVAPGNQDKVKVLARFDHGEGAGPAAILEVDQGEGQWFIWSFSPELSWTNLPKTTRFVPFLHETVKYLGRFSEDRANYHVGEAYALTPGEDETHVRLPDGREQELAGTGPQPLNLDRAGILQTRNSKGQWQVREAVNIPGAESDPETIAIDEFSLKLTANGGTAEGNAHQDIARNGGDIEKRNEFGYLFIVALGLFLMLEVAYAARLSKKLEEERVADPRFAGSSKTQGGGS